MVLILASTMKYLLTACALLGLGLTIAVAHPAAPADSVGIELKDGKRFILHRVDQGQTLFAIARRYHSSVGSITAANPELSQGIRYDQLIRIPIADAPTTRPAQPAEPTPKPAPTPTATRPAEPAPKPAPAPAEPDPRANEGIHVVGTGQTLYRLAVMYHVSQADLRKWNGLSSDNVRLGQALIVSERAYLDRQPTNAKPASKTVAAVTPKPEPARPEPTPKPEPAKPEPTPKPEPANPKPVATRPAAATTTKPESNEEVIRPGANAPLPTTGRRISETGLAELIDDNQGSTKFLALHRTAPVGTLVLVRNDENNQSIWVKVIGRIPDTGVNDNVLIKLSSRAFAKLGTADRRFRAEVSYVAP